MEISEKFSFNGWNIWKFISGRKKLLITIIGVICANLALDPDLAGLLAGGVVFEGIWGILEYWIKRKD